MNAEQYLAGMVAIDSTSNKSNEPMIAHLERIVSPLGFACRRVSYRDLAGVEKHNLVATRNASASGEVALALVGHTDCVPFDPQWSEALRLTARDGKLFARGAADTKGFIAAALEAVELKRSHPLGGGLALIFTADEEVGCVGAKRLVEEHGTRPRWAIIGEPTSLRPVRAHKGYCVAEVEIQGKEAHSAYPDLGASAVRGAGRFLALMEELDADLRARPNTDFAPPYTTTNVGLIQGGTAKNIIAGGCRLTVEWRPVPDQEASWVADRLRALGARVESEIQGLRVIVDARRLDSGLNTPHQSPLLRFLQQQSGNSPATVAFGTEGPQLTQMGAEAVVFGPGDIGVAHRTGEFVPSGELDRAVRILGEALGAFAS